MILDGVRPLFHTLQGQVDSAYYTRHWRNGPHLRLNIRTTASRFADVVRPAVDGIVGAFLTRHPSTKHLDPTRELAVHRRLAELEQEEGELLPWFPDNTIVTAPYDARTAVVGGPQTAALVADFQSRATALAFRMTEELSPRQRLARSFDCMIAVAQTMATRGITNGFISFRSHAEGFLCGFPESAGLRPAWDRHYDIHRESLRSRVRAVVAAVPENIADVPFVQEWIAALRPSWERAERLASAGALALPMGVPAHFEAEAGDRVDLAEVSPFHQVLLANPTWEQTARSSAFLQYRLMLNLTYLMMTRIGVTPVERFLLCHLVANTVEDTYGVSAVELVRGRSASEQIAGIR
ncbi:thiopeptide maturation pyridine synthase [Dactylosporangium sp. NPDC051541]|uniref:thiopeptide maturation pyridine synthase n=1 Tax=Dactylosporangium sp. NPDC051541 TaxID=3363977 RepID=UPI00378846B0